MNDEDGFEAVRIARSVIESWVSEGKRYRPERYPEIFNERRGVFVTLHTYPENNLRGCIGYPEPVMPLIDALIDAAISSTMDPRFEKVRPEELSRLIVEVSILTTPKLISVKDPREYPEKVKIGEDGLIVRKGFYSGLLLPQVATEHGFDAEEFLSQTCIKAGLLPDEWLKGGVDIYKFQAEIFREISPKGEIRRIK